MNSTILLTKLFTPPRQNNFVLRSRLNAFLDKAYQAGVGSILVSAPAGYGKTTLISQWLQDSHIPSTWLSLDEEDNDAVVFMQYFITALQKIIPTIKLDLLKGLQGTQLASLIALLNILINEITEQNSEFIFILDDFQVIYNQNLLELFTHLLDHKPSQMRMILLSRADPPLPLSRWRVRNQLLDIRVDQLRFTTEEMEAFFNEKLALGLSPHEIQSLDSRTEGWIASLQLAGISIQGSNNKHQFITDFAGSHFYIMDYLVEEVFKNQPQSLVLFLLQTSILERLHAPLCDAIVNPGATNPIIAQEMLEDLEHRNLFLVPLDENRRWYRYHHLFADVLNRRLEQLYPDQIPELHRRASQWYEQSGFYHEAIHHALASGDRDRAAQLVDSNGCSLLMRGEVTNLLKWIEGVEPASQTYPWIAIQKAWSLSLFGEFERANGAIQSAEKLIASLEPSSAIPTMTGALITARAFVATSRGEAGLAANLAQQAFDCLPPDNDFSCSLRSVATSILGDSSRMIGNLAEAKRAYQQALAISRAVGDRSTEIIANCDLGDVLLEQGHLHQAYKIFTEVIQTALLEDGKPSSLAEKGFTGLSKISYEWNRLEECDRYVHQCIELARRWEGITSQATGLMILANLERIRGNSDHTRDYLQAAERLIMDNPISPWIITQLKSSMVPLWIMEENVEKADLFIQELDLEMSNIPLGKETIYRQEPLLISRLRMNLAQGNFIAAQTIAEKLMQGLTNTDRVSRIIETLVLQALSFFGSKAIDQALESLTRAFVLAEPEGYIRIFLDQGDPMAKLLYLAKAHRTGSSYADKLISELEKTPGENRQLSQLLIEPLTPREIEILRFIDGGFSNQEIASKLFISLVTVKRHISNIYTKLGVKSRTQAISMGRELKLIE